ncbi:NPP1 family protein [Hahella sp. KA22]|uniref:NPP1 family protein n=1 Tax=Hahella sp. KA22 TaxID=1628392 RepID=UPI0013E2E73D|nr:NPP1 family protein [Hahella sp. KA22]
MKLMNTAIPVSAALSVVVLISLHGNHALAKDWSHVDKCPSNQNACFIPIVATTAAADMEYTIGFDFDTDGCLPSAGVSKDMKPNPGIKNSGSLDGHCAYQNQLSYSNTMHRATCVSANGNEYCSQMFALYFVKDQVVAGADAFGHTNDWEFGLIWTTNQQLTHASYSHHGKVTTAPVSDLYSVKPNQVLMVYHKDGGSTHAMRFAKPGEIPENPTCMVKCEWVTPNIADWNKIAAGYRDVFTEHNYGKANMPMKEANFIPNITLAIPPGYPPANIWQ